MALWGNNDAVGSAGTVVLAYETGVLTGAGTSFGIAGGCSVGDVIRITGVGDAVVVSIANSENLTIGSTAGLSGAEVAGAEFTVSQLPKYTVLDSARSEVNSDYDSFVYGVAAEGAGAASTTGSYAVDHTGWVGVTTYMDNEGNLRVKKETLVAMSGITTGNAPVYDANPGV